jgi:hypothetical protein
VVAGDAGAAAATGAAGAGVGDARGPVQPFDFGHAPTEEPA